MKRIALIVVLIIFSLGFLVVICLSYKHSYDPDYYPQGWIDMGLSVKWEDRNLGVKSPEQAGDLIRWIVEDRYVFYNNGDSTKFLSVGATTDSVNEVINQERLSGWGLPTRDEYLELIDKCSWQWTELNGVKGFRVSSNIPGYMNRSIFLPAGGYRILDGDPDSVYDKNVVGAYWSGTRKDSENGFCLVFDSLQPRMEIKPLSLRGLNLRLVCE